MPREQHRLSDRILGALQVETSIVCHLLELVDEADRNKDGKIDFDEWQFMGMFLRLFVSLCYSS